VHCSPFFINTETAKEKRVGNANTVVVSGRELSVLHRRRHGLSFYGWMIIPAVILLLAITVYPFFWMIVMSLFKVAVRPGAKNEFVGLVNFLELFKDHIWVAGWGIQAKYVGIALVIEFILGFTVALLLNSIRRGANLLTTIFLFPMMVAPVAVGFLYLYIFNASFGWYFWFLRTVGILKQGSILGDLRWALAGIIIADIWEWTPLMALVLLAGLKKVPLDQMEAAKCDGAGPIRRFIDVTLPNMTPVIVIAVLIRFMDIMRYIDKIFVMTTGGPAGATKTVSFYLFQAAFQYFELGRGAAMGFLLLLLTIGLAIAFVNLLKRKGVQR
jgi:multiple sugar transport system permease protein